MTLSSATIDSVGLAYAVASAPGSLRNALLAELEHSASQQVIQGLARCCATAAGIAAGARGDAARPGRRPTVTALAERARLTRRTCERWFTKVGLPSPRVVMVLTRLLYAHRLLLDPGYTVEDVALKLGYSKTKTLQMHLRAVFGLTAGELRVSLSTEDALATVTSRYFTPLHRRPRREAARILVIDDEPALRRTLERALRGMGCEVVSAGDRAPGVCDCWTRWMWISSCWTSICRRCRATRSSSRWRAAGPGLAERIILMTGDTFAEKRPLASGAAELSDYCSSRSRWRRWGTRCWRRSRRRVEEAKRASNGPA